MNLKKLLLGVGLLALLASLPLESYSQGKGGPPPWAPAHGYRAKTRHIYFPDHNFYFDLQKEVYIFLNKGSWAVAAKLPALYGKVNLKTALQIELELFDDSPYKYNGDHQKRYKVKKQQHDQRKQHQNRGNGNGRRN